MDDFRPSTSISERASAARARERERPARRVEIPADRRSDSRTGGAASRALHHLPSAARTAPERYQGRYAPEPELGRERRELPLSGPAPGAREQGWRATASIRTPRARASLRLRFAQQGGRAGGKD